MASATFLAAINRALHEEGQANDRVMYLGEDIGAYGGFSGQDVGLLEAFGPTRVRDCPMAEGGQIGVAIGLAIGGWTPVVELMFAEFLPLTCDELGNWASMMHMITNGEVSVPLTVRAIAGVAQLTSHPQIYEAWFAGIPGIKVVAPSNPHDAAGLLKAAIRDPNPVVFYEHSMLLESEEESELPDAIEPIELGTARIVRPGTDITIVAHSLMLHRAVEAAERLEADGINAEVLDLRTLSPLPIDAVVESVRRTGALLVVQEDWPACSVSSEVVSQVAEADVRLRVAPRRLTQPGVPVTVNRRLQEYLIPTTARIVETVQEMVRTEDVVGAAASAGRGAGR